MNNVLDTLSTIALAIIGLAIVSVLVSKNANTAGVIQAGASGLANNIGVAQSPVSGSSVSLNLGYPSNSLTSSFGF